MTVFIIVFGLGVLLLLVRICISAAGEASRTVHRYRKCPHCGARAEIRGSVWECGFCGDSGWLNQKSK